MDRMFDKDSFDDLKSTAEVRQAVDYFTHNEIGFKSELTSEGLSYAEVQKETIQIWLSLLKLCDKYKYTNYIIEDKRKLYKDK